MEYFEPHEPVVVAPIEPKRKSTAATAPEKVKPTEPEQDPFILAAEGTPVVKSGANPVITTAQANEIIKAAEGLSEEQIVEIVERAGAKRIDQIQVSALKGAIQMAKDMVRS
jgi:hypothetical protein